MTQTFVLAFNKSFWATILSEIGDKTFFIAAILALKHSRLPVFLGASGALILMTALSVLFGFAAPQLINKKYTHYAAVAMFLFFGLKSIYDFFTAEAEDEYAEAEEELEALDKEEKKKKADGKSKALTLACLLSPVFIKAFSLTFVAEWGDRSQITTFGLAASSEPYGVGVGGFIAHSLCTGLAVLAGKQLKTYINERFMQLLGGFLFFVFGVQALINGPESS